MGPYGASAVLDGIPAKVGIHLRAAGSIANWVASVVRALSPGRVTPSQNALILSLSKDEGEPASWFDRLTMRLLRRNPPLDDGAAPA
jgi:hypothetical protein